MEIERTFPQWDARTYHADREHVSKSWLDQIDRTPAHLAAYLSGERAFSTKALDLGSVSHSWILEPDSIESTYIAMPKLDRRTKEGKVKYAELLDEAEQSGRILVDADSFETAIRMRDSVYAHKAAARLLSKGQRERTVLWMDPNTGVACKARADLLREDLGTVVDVKSTVDAGPESFAKSIVKFRYDVQAAHYREGFNCAHFAWIAVEKSPPYAVAVYVDDDDIFFRGKAARDRNLRLYAECAAKNEWPAYPQQIQSIQLPRWAS